MLPSRKPLVSDSAPAQSRAQGMWTRFFPAVERARALLAAGAIGDVVALQGTFGIDGASDVGEYPSDTIFRHSLGGGAVTLLGPYLVEAALLAFDDGMPFSRADLPRVAAGGVMDAGEGVGGGGAELAAAAVLTFPAIPSATCTGHRRFRGSPQSGGGAGAVASIVCSLVAEADEQVSFVGTRGTLTLKAPAHCPTEVVLQPKCSGRGATATPQHFVDALPHEPHAVASTGGFIMPNSIGFAYEAAAVAERVAEGERGCPQWSRDESLKTMALVEAWRDQVHRLGGGAAPSIE